MINFLETQKRLNALTSAFFEAVKTCETATTEKRENGLAASQLLSEIEERQNSEHRKAAQLLNGQQQALEQLRDELQMFSERQARAMVVEEEFTESFDTSRILALEAQISALEALSKSRCMTPQERNAWYETETRLEKSFHPAWLALQKKLAAYDELIGFLDELRDLNLEDPVRTTESWTARAQLLDKDRRE